MNLSRLSAAVVLFSASFGLAGPPRSDFWSPPKGAAAWWLFDPGPLGPGESTDPGKALIEAGLRALLSRVMPLEDLPPISPVEFISPGVLGSAPYRLCLLDLTAADAPGRPAPDRPSPLDSLAAVLVVERPAPHDDLVALVRSRLTSGGAQPPAERTVDLPGGAGLKATVVGDRTRAVSWSSTPNAFIIGFGEGAVEKWLSAEPLPANSEPALALSQIEHARSGTRPVLEASVDLNALRHAAPEQFAYGRIARLADAWQLSNGRMFMISARIGTAMDPAHPPLLGVDAAFSARSESPGVVHTLQISDGVWPPEAGPVEPAPYAVVLHPNWPGWLATGVSTSEALSPAGGGPAHAAADRWMRAHRFALDRLLSQAAAMCILRGGPTGATFRNPIIPAPHRARTEAAMRDVWGSLGPEVSLNPATRAWSLTVDEAKSDPDKLLRHFFWAMRGDGLALVGGWQAEPVEKAAAAGP